MSSLINDLCHMTNKLTIRMDSLKSGTSLATVVSSKTRIKADSAPVILQDDLQCANKLKPQTSAPCYFHSLSINEAPPFRRPYDEKKPHILIGLLVTEEDVVRMIAVADAESDVAFKRYLADYLVDKNITLPHHVPEKMFLVNLMLQLIDYSAQRDFDAHKLACLLAIYLATHLCFKRHFWTASEAIWGYFNETLIRHTIEDSPDGCEVFSPEESYDILTHFHTVYISNLPLIHVLCFGVFRVKFSWPFKSVCQSLDPKYFNIISLFCNFQLTTSFALL